MPTQISGRGKSEGSKRTQAKPGGPSLNPGGRPRGSENRNKVIRDVLGKIVTGDMDGKKKRISITEASLLRLAQKAMTGDLKAIQMVLTLWKESEDSYAEGNSNQYPLSDADRAVIDEIYARMKASQEG